MDIQEQRHGAVTIVKPIGPLVQTDAEQFKVRLLELTKERLGRVAVDSSAVPFVDSEALEGLVEVSEKMSQSGQALKICGANDTVREVLELTNLAALFEHFEDVNGAVRSFL